MIKGIIFDYGGTLDTGGRHWVHVLREGWEHAGMRVPEPIFREAYVQGERAMAVPGVVSPADDFYVMLLKKTRVALSSISEPAQYYIGSDSFYLERVVEEIARYCDGVAARCTAKSAKVLKCLSQKYKLCLVSNFYGNLRSVLSEYGLLRYFPHVIESAEVGVRKPDPRIFEFGLAALGLPPNQVLVVGDSIDKDIVPARAIGCRTAWLRGEGWDNAPQHSPADIEIASLADLL